MTKIRRSTPITQRFFCWQTRRKCSREVSQFVRVRLKLEGSMLKRRKALPEDEAVFGKVA